MTVLLFTAIGEQLLKVSFNPPSHPIGFHIENRRISHLSPSEGPNPDGSLTNVQSYDQKYDVVMRFSKRNSQKYSMHGRIENAVQTRSDGQLDPHQVLALNHTVIHALFNSFGRFSDDVRAAKALPPVEAHWVMIDMINELGEYAFMDILYPPKPIKVGTTWTSKISRKQYRPSGEQIWTVEGEPICLSYRVTAITKGKTGTLVTIRKSANATIRLSTPADNDSSVVIRQDDEFTLNARDGLLVRGLFKRSYKDQHLAGKATRVFSINDVVITIGRK